MDGIISDAVKALVAGWGPPGIIIAVSFYANVRLFKALEKARADHLEDVKQVNKIMQDTSNTIRGLQTAIMVGRGRDDT